MKINNSRKIFILKGSESTGKTETLLRLCSILYGVSDSSSLQRYCKWTSDCHGIFVFDNTTICVATAGDNKEEIDENLKFFNEHNPTIIFTALLSSKRKNNNEKKLEDFARYKKYESEIINKSKRKTNAQEAMGLFNKIIYIGEVYEKN